MFNSVPLTLYFNSRPHGGRHSHGAGIGSSFCISTHALTEGDVDKVPIIPTPSISTHALTEGDSFQKPPEALKRSFQLTPSRRATGLIRWRNTVPTFQLTPSRRATDLHSQHYSCRRKFQLTPSRRATDWETTWYGKHDISTHALTEGDPKVIVCFQLYRYFNSRPHGGRP